jgi:dihydropteroate synthase
MQLKLGKHSLSLDRPRIMGVLNVTPDSFSDGGQFLAADDAIRHAEVLVEAGADIVDVGGESTRPGAAVVSEAEEIDRVVPVIEAIAARFDIPVSVDTGKPGVMEAAVSAGAGMINDIYALRLDGALDMATSLDAAICLMHMQGMPSDMQKQPHYDRLPGEVIDFLAERLEVCMEAGMGVERIVIDPGFGFGKNHDHNLQILASLDQFSALGRPILVGLSRKRTLGHITGRPVTERVAAGVAAAVMAYEKGAAIIRTHDVAETVDALKVAEAVRVAGNKA